MAAAKKSLRWGAKKTLKFARLYRMEECLWNKNHPANKNRVCRDVACMNISRSMGSPYLTLTQVKLKINILRNTYLQVVKKINDSKGTYKPTVLWFKEMDAVMGKSVQPEEHLDKVTTVIKQEPPLLVEDTIVNQTEGLQEQMTYYGSPGIGTLKEAQIESYDLGLVRECEAFGNYIAACLTRLPAGRRTELENSIFQMLMKEKNELNRNLEEYELGRDGSPAQVGEV